MPKPNNHSGIERHKRVNDILLASIEKPLLAWLVMILPGWVTPDMLTIFGFLASILIGVSYILTNQNRNYLWLATLGFVLNWFGDSLDGNLARHRKIERPRYGFFIDHSVDIMSEVFIFLGLAFSPYVDFKIGALALIAYLCMTNLVFLITSVEGVFQISYGRLGPTEARVIAIASNTIIYFTGNPMVRLPFGMVNLFNVIVLGVIALLVIFFVYTTIAHGIALSRSDQAARKKE
jgi:archaetidylinositol phosphate synthase